MAYTVDQDYIFSQEILNTLKDEPYLITVTAHRRENLGEPMERIASAVKRLAENNPQVKMVWPVHKNPAVMEIAHRKLGNLANVHLIEPLDPSDMHNLMAQSYLILTDSGGIQEEAPALGKPVLVMRDVTERPEAVAAGTVLLVGTDEELIVSKTTELLHDQEAYAQMQRAVNPYGDGQASRRIVEAIEYAFLKRSSPPEPFTGEGN